jgi:predicted nucleic acid-binding protein
MASNRIGFNQFIKKVQGENDLNVLVDSNILIANFDETHTNYDVVSEFLKELDNVARVNFFTTITTKAEFLDYQRRRFLTEGLFELVSREPSKKQLKPDSKQIIAQMKLRRGKRATDEEKRSLRYDDHYDSSVNYLRDNEIKEIKKQFRARDVQEEIGWLSICELFLVGKLDAQEKLLDEFCNYLSPHNEHQAHLFNNVKIDWNKATGLTAKTGMGYSDALILNMFSETNMKFIITLDFDLIYAVSVSSQDKFVVLPDSRLGTMKSILKKIN